MSNNYYRRNVCRMCGGRDIKVVVKLTPTPVGGSFVAPDKIHEIDETYPLDLYQCSFCGYACLMDVVAPELLFTPSIQVTSMSLGVVENLGQLARTIIDRVKPSQGSLVVDIGSNDGTLLKFFKEAGMHVLGVEPASFASDKANGSGIETICDFFNRDVARKIKHQKGPAKIITAIRVFANIDDLDEFVEGVRELLAPDGVFAFETAYIVDVLDKTMVETIYHEHLSYDSVNALDIFFKRHRMQLVDIEHIPLKGGSLRGVVQTADGPMSVAPSVDAMKANEAALGINQPGPFKEFESRVNRAKTELETLVRNIKEQGKTVAGYGASVGSTTMIYHFGLGELLSFLVDDDPQNQHLYSPGHHIPVFPSSALNERNPDHVVIIAWRYAEAIIKKHQAYLDRGGHFVLPIPEVKVI